MMRGNLRPQRTSATKTIAALVVGIAIGFVAGLSGCGVKSAPIAPEYTRPERILDLRAQSANGGIKLTWTRPSHYVGGHSMRDLGGFVVMRADGDGPATPLVKIPVTDQERFQIEEDFSYFDGETKLGNSYRYSVIAETLDGYHSEASNEVEITRRKPPILPNPDTYKLPAPPASPAVTP
jgi:hypothetical protein